MSNFVGIRNFPQRVIYNSNFVPPLFQPAPALAPEKGYRCLLCSASGPHFIGCGNHLDADNRISAVSVSKESMEKHVRKYHYDATTPHYCDADHVKTVWIQKIYSNNLGYFEVNMSLSSSNGNGYAVTQTDVDTFSQYRDAARQITGEVCAPWACQLTLTFCYNRKTR